MSNDDIKLTMSVPAAGRRFFGLGKNASYRAAGSGDLPCVKIGGRLFASIPAIEKMLLEAGSKKEAVL